MGHEENDLFARLEDGGGNSRPTIDDFYFLEAALYLSAREDSMRRRGNRGRSGRRNRNDNSLLRALISGAENVATGNDGSGSGTNNGSNNDDDGGGNGQDRDGDQEGDSGESARNGNGISASDVFFAGLSEANQIEMAIQMSLRDEEERQARERQQQQQQNEEGEEEQQQQQEGGGGEEDQQQQEEEEDEENEQSQQSQQTVNEEVFTQGREDFEEQSGEIEEETIIFTSIEEPAAVTDTLQSETDSGQEGEDEVAISAQAEEMEETTSVRAGEVEGSDSVQSEEIEARESNINTEETHTPTVVGGATGDSM